MNKAKKYAQTGAIVFGLGNAIINLIDQLNNTTSNKKFDWGKLLSATGKGALVGGTGGFIFGSIRDNQMSQVFSKYGSVPNYLHNSLSYFKDDNKLLVDKAEQVKTKLYRKFKNDLAEAPKFHGSIAKGTSIYGSDIDIQLQFRKDFGTLSDVYYSVSNYVFDEFRDVKLENIREQMHSIGLEFKINDEVKRIDIIPTRQIENGKNDTCLFVNKTGFFEKPTYKKTNSQIQLASLTFNYREKRIVRLLKIWKAENNLKIKSIHLEWLAKNSFQKKSVSNNIQKALADVILFIASNIEFIRIVDPANSNNIISNTLTIEDKGFISRLCYKMLEDIKKDSRNVIDYFPSLESIA
jgi:predicted nucleotidyltransferase